MVLHRFDVPVLFDGNEYRDSAILLLPDSYNENGNKTRLVISCHGAGGTVTADDSQVEVQALTKYLLDNGYAVLDAGGLPRSYADENGINIYNNIGSPIAVDCYCNAYVYCVNRFNLHKEVFLHGASMGGISSTNLLLSGRIPVIAHTLFCPVLDTYNHIFLHPWSDGLPKIALGKFYRLDLDGSGEYVYDESKISGYNPVNNSKARNYPVPLKIWHCLDDDTVSVDVTISYAQTLLDNGSDVNIVLLEHGGHEPQLVGPPVLTPCGRTDDAINPAVDGVLEFIFKHDK